MWHGFPHIIETNKKQHQKGEGGGTCKNRRMHCGSERYYVLEVSCTLKCLNNVAALQFPQKKALRVFRRENDLKKSPHAEIPALSSKKEKSDPKRHLGHSCTEPFMYIFLFLVLFFCFLLLH